MQVSPFTFEPDSPVREPADADPHAAMRAAAPVDRERDEQAHEETPEEPGYGHGV